MLIYTYIGSQFWNNNSSLKSQFLTLCFNICAIQWFNQLHPGRMLTVRDLLSWVAFINMTERSLGPEFAFLHGAFLVLLDGLSLGTFLLCYSSTCPCTFYSLIVNNCIFLFKTVWLSIYFYHFLLMVGNFFYLFSSGKSFLAILCPYIF